ncbi:unnamed protein product [Durusdinium trenchii]|uniref:Uncharacterized protein n=2 Tax=Durusdinium trenchii TaxID=1381693 RepID=A0ABP0LSX3_9DINO
MKDIGERERQLAEGVVFAPSELLAAAHPAFFTLLRIMLLHRRGDDVDGLSWDDVAVEERLLFLLVQDPNAMNGLVKLWTHHTFKVCGSETEARGSGVGDAGCRALALGIAQMHHLTKLELELDCNRISKDGCIALADGISNLRQMTHLILSLKENEIGSDGCTTLAKAISKLHITQLTLFLKKNNIGKAGFRALADGLCQLQGVTQLRLGLEENEDPGEAAKLKGRLKARFPSAEIDVDISG